MHLQMAERVRSASTLNKTARQKVTDNLPAFYLGNVAADLQAICDVPRATTHFYDIPPDRDVEAYETMLTAHPELANPAGLTHTHAVFIAGYCMHLLFDLVWYWDILHPHFLTAPDWPVEMRERFVVHHTLLTYLDKVAYQSLPAGAGQTLAQAHANQWLPVATDQQLHDWRDLLTIQFEPGQPLQTVQIYAKRLKMSPTEFATNLATPAWMEANVFHRMPLKTVHTHFDIAWQRSITFLNNYLT